MTSILADRQYTLSDYNNYEKLNMTPELEEDVIEKINRLAKRVGAPSYQKTPVFKRNNYHKRPVKKDNISASDWQSIRNFKTTKLEKNTEGLEAQMDKIRSCLNKLTDATYDIMLDEIKYIMKDINKEQNQDFQKDVIGMRSLSNSFESNKGIS